MSVQEDALLLIDEGESPYITRFAAYHTEVGGNSERVKDTVATMKTYLKQPDIVLPDLFVGCGTSGACMASVLSYEFDIPFINICKGHIDRMTHSFSNRMSLLPNVSFCEGYNSKRYWFVDDCIDSGITFWKVFHLCEAQRMDITGLVIANDFGICCDEINDLIVQRDLVHIDLQ